MSAEFDAEAMNREMAEEFRANAGVVGGAFHGASLLILHATGAKTGKRQHNPLMFREEDGRRFIFAPLSGAPKKPRRV